jgi:hypothetical protein
MTVAVQQVRHALPGFGTTSWLGQIGASASQGRVDPQDSADMMPETGHPLVRAHLICSLSHLICSVPAFIEQIG